MSIRPEIRNNPAFENAAHGNDGNYSSIKIGRRQHSYSIRMIDDCETVNLSDENLLDAWLAWLAWQLSLVSVSVRTWKGYPNVVIKAVFQSRLADVRSLNPRSSALNITNRGYGQQQSTLHTYHMYVWMYVHMYLLVYVCTG